MITPTWISVDDAKSKKYVDIFSQLREEMDFVEALETCINLTMYALQMTDKDIRTELVQEVISEFQQLKHYMEMGAKLNGDVH